MADRVKILLLSALLIGVPGAIVRSTCAVGCTSAEAGRARVPFCSLPAALRTDLAAGFRDGRSPDILAVPQHTAVMGSFAPGGEASATGTWPSTDRTPDTNVPIVFAGTGIDGDATVPVGTGLRQIAPTVARAIDFERPFPKVRSGRPVPGIAASSRPRLILQVVWKNVGTSELASDPRLGRTWSGCYSRGPARSGARWGRSRSIRRRRSRRSAPEGRRRSTASSGPGCVTSEATWSAPGPRPRPPA